MQLLPLSCRWRWIDRYRDLLAVQVSQPERYPFLLESVARGTSTARYDILFAFPQGSLMLKRGAQLRADTFSPKGGDFLHNFDAWWWESRVCQPPAINVPFHGGWFVYLGYELVAQLEPRLTLPLPDDVLPIAAAYRIPAAIVRDHLRCRTLILVEADYPELLGVLEDDLTRAPELSPPNGDRLNESLREEPSQVFLSRVQLIQHYIRNGDVFQVNLSRGWQGLLKRDVSNEMLYDRLRRCNPAPFAGLAVFGDAAILSSSPERLVRVRQGTVETRPIAGTHPRSGKRSADQALSSALSASPKERSEHIMLIDLERNDLSKVCQIGSVQVPELMVIESYAHVHHLVSSVCGRLRRGVTPGDVIRAVFPGGTITGCPKVRCMELIAELEAAPRGPYTGAMGYVNHDGGMDLNILIRTVVRHGERVWLRTGAGIVADSVPAFELKETRYKAQGPLRALDQAIRWH